MADRLWAEYDIAHVADQVHGDNDWPLTKAARKAIEDSIRAEEAENWREALLREWVGNHDDHCGRNKWEHDNYGCSHPLIDLLRETYSDELTAITDYEARLLSRPEASE
jgi:hypothetical protein